MLTTFQSRLLAAVLWTLGLAVACLLPGQQVPTVRAELSLDKIAHLVLFAGFGVLWMRALRAMAWGAGGPSNPALWVLGVGGAFAVGTEVLQYVLPLGRHFDLLDAAANAVGLAVAVLGYRRFARRSAQPDAS
jgi:glycopeptide antibiotics resistance protein